MIDFVKGSKNYLDPLYLVVETSSGIGYRFFITKESYEVFVLENTIKVYAYVQFVNDQYFLYGFNTLEERGFFKTLIGVSGVGPRLAVRILSHVSYKDFYRYIINEDAKAISLFPGIGLKTAQKIVLETKDKLPLVHLEEGSKSTQTNLSNEVFTDAFMALENFGYDSTKIKNAINELKKTSLEWTLESLIKELLALLNKK